MVAMAFSSLETKLAYSTTAYWLSMWHSLARNLPSGLEIGVGDPRFYNQQKEKADNILSMLRKRGLPATLEMDDQNIDLYDGEDLAIRLAAVDPVGQVYSQVRPDSAEEQQEVFERHIRVLARAQSL